MATFNDYGLKEELVQAVTELGFTTPSPIQQETIPLLINEQTDIIALAQTGTGKTAAFGLPLLHRIDEHTNKPQALILSPTRELCIQIKNEMDKYSSILRTKIVAVYGGAPISGQIKDLKRGTQVIVATPGRLIDLINRKVVKLENIETIVLDEADEMLNMGFRDDIEFILEEASNRGESWLFSATMNNDVRRIASRFMNRPKEVAVAKENIGNENIEHQYYVTNHRHRFEVLQRLLDLVPDIYGIIFTRTKQDAHDITEKLIKDGYMVSAIHGDLDQRMRTKVMNSFKRKNLQVLVATDVAARGIDVNDITHVINYELPDDPEVYTHRSGRTARAGKSGICISITTPKEISKVRRIERIVNSKFEKKHVPEGEEVIKNRLSYFLQNLEKVELESEFLSFYEENIESLIEHLPAEELIKRLLWMQLKNTYETYSSASNLNASASSGRRGAHVADGDQRLYINLGRKDGLNPKKLADYIADTIDFKYNQIDRISVTDKSSFFNVPKDSVRYVIDNLSSQKYKGRKIRIEEAEESPSGGGRGGYGGRGYNSRGGGRDYRGGNGGRTRNRSFKRNK